MIWNMRRRKKPRQLAWRFFTNGLVYSESRTFTVTFESAGKEFGGIQVTVSPKQGLTTMKYTTGNPLGGASVYTKFDGFIDAKYRNVIFKESPTGDLLAFLQENATPL